ncbi:MAG: ABC transporter permease [Actinobacteria bacterium]|nr:ABC transporter permease [Actinomycetota bacterium]
MDRLLRGYGAAVYLFLFVPIAVVVVFSFNAGEHVAELTGFSLRWYVEAWTNPFIVEAFRTSITVALTSATISMFLGTAAALAMPSAPRRLRRTFDVMVNTALVVPGIVLGISLLIFIVTATNWLNSWIAYLVPSSDLRLGLGFASLVAAHSVFGTALVTILVRTRLASMDLRVIEASADLYAPPLRTVCTVTLPLLAPAIFAGFLLAFTFSFDDFIIAFFTRGRAETLPIYLFASIRRGVSPVVNATASSLLAMTVTCLAVAAVVFWRRGSNRTEKGIP